MSADPDCIFCRILAGELPGQMRGEGAEFTHRHFAPVLAQFAPHAGRDVGGLDLAAVVAGLADEKDGVTVVVLAGFEEGGGVGYGVEGGGVGVVVAGF